MKTFVLLGVLAFFLSPIYAQKDKSKKLSVNYLHIPVMDATSHKPENLTIEFASEAIIFDKEKLKDVKTTCKNNATGKAQEVTTYYYDVSYTYPESYVVGSDASGNIIFAEKISESNYTSKRFGYQECKNFKSDNLKKKWASDADKFKNKISSDEEKKLFEEAQITTKESVYPYYLPMEFEVYYAKGKDFDYTDLENAVEWASDACKLMDKEGLNAEIKVEFEKCITLWEKELATAQLENKDARINKNIAKGLHENCVWAYTLIHEFDKALEHGREFKLLFGNHSNNRTVAMDKLLAMVREQSIRAENNAELAGNLAAMNQMAQGFKKAEIELIKVPSTEIDRLSTAYIQSGLNRNMAVVNDMKQQEEQLVAEGKINPYEKFVTRTATGNSILMNMAPSSLSGIPEITVFPKEICEMDDIGQVMIISNKITTIPPEIANMKALSDLNLSGNAITNIPPEIGQLPKLKKLNLSKNPISDFPKEIGQLKELKKLNMKNTKLSAEKQAELQALLPNCKISF